MVSLENLKGLRLFRNVSGDQLERFIRSASIRTVAGGQNVFTAHDDHRRLYILLQGVVKTFVTSASGMEQITNLFYPGDVFGGLVFGTDQNPKPWAEAIDDAKLIILTEDQFKGLMGSYADVCLNIFSYMVHHHQLHVRRIRTLIHTRSSHRLVLTLLSLGDRQGDGDKEDVPIQHRFTHEDLGNMIGVVRSTVSELMGDLRRYGVVTIKGRSITVHRSLAYHFLSCDQEECQVMAAEALAVSTPG